MKKEKNSDKGILISCATVLSVFFVLPGHSSEKVARSFEVKCRY